MAIVYVVQNPAFPHLFKIGYTKKDSTEERGLNASNVPEDFKVLYAFECKDPKKMEEALHEAFADFRHYTTSGRKTEFFYIKCIKKVLKLLEQIGVEIESDDLVLEEDSESEYVPGANIEQLLTPKKSRTTFSMLGIEPGTILEFILNEEECSVKDTDSVVYEGKDYTLSGLARELYKKHKPEGKSKNYNGWLCFKVKGEDKTLAEKRKQLDL